MRIMLVTQNKIWQTLDYKTTRSDNNRISERKSGDLSRQVTLKVNTLLDEFEAYLNRQVIAITTRKKYIKDIKQFCNEKGVLCVEEINRESINDWILVLRKRNLTVGTIAAHLWAIKKFLAFVTEEKNLIYYRWDIRIPKVSSPESVEFLELEEIKELYGLIGTVDIQGLRLRTFIEVMLGTGMRPSEALSLQKSDFVKTINELEIIGKGNKKRTVYFTPEAIYWINSYISQRTDDCQALFVTHHKNKKNCPLKLRSAEDRFQQLIKKSSIKRHIVLHDLRHTFATQYVRNGCDAGFIMLLLGHSSIKTTRKYYIAVSKKHAKEAFFKFNPFAGLSSSTAITSQLTPLQAH